MDIGNNPDSTQNIDDEQIKKFLEDFDLNKRYEQNLTGEPEKLSDAPYEIVFNITASVLEENQKGEKIGSKHICTKFYHIPVPLDGDYNIFMKSFFDFLEQSLASSATKAYDETNPYKKETE